MSESSQFRQYAEEALLWVAQSKTEEEKQLLLGLVRTWTEAAAVSEFITTVAQPEVRADALRPGEAVDHLAQPCHLQPTRRWGQQMTFTIYIGPATRRRRRWKECPKRQSEQVMFLTRWTMRDTPHSTGERSCAEYTLQPPS